jgi:hypothetical protein
VIEQPHAWMPWMCVEQHSPSFSVEISVHLSVLLKHTTEYKPDKTWIARRQKDLMSELQLTEYWKSSNLQLPQDAKIKQQMKPHTIRKRWICYATQKIYIREQTLLLQWKNEPPGRKRTYMEITALDHEQWKET